MISFKHIVILVICSSNVFAGGGYEDLEKSEFPISSAQALKQKFSEVPGLDYVEEKTGVIGLVAGTDQSINSLNIIVDRALEKYIAANPDANVTTLKLAKSQIINTLAGFPEAQAKHALGGATEKSAKTGHEKINACALVYQGKFDERFNRDSVQTAHQTLERVQQEQAKQSRPQPIIGNNDLKRFRKSEELLKVQRAASDETLSAIVEVFPYVSGQNFQSIEEVMGAHKALICVKQDNLTPAGKDIVRTLVDDYQAAIRKADIKKDFHAYGEILDAQASQAAEQAKLAQGQNELKLNTKRLTNALITPETSNDFLINELEGAKVKVDEGLKASIRHNPEVRACLIRYLDSRVDDKVSTAEVMSVVGAGSQIGMNSKSRDVRRACAIGNALDKVHTAKAVISAVGIKSLACAHPIAAAVVAVQTVLEAFLGDEDGTELILNELADFRSEVRELFHENRELMEQNHKEVLYKFEGAAKQLDEIYYNSLRPIEYKIDSVAEAVEFTAGLVEGNARAQMADTMIQNSCVARSYIDDIADSETLEYSEFVNRTSMLRVCANDLAANPICNGKTLYDLLSNEPVQRAKRISAILNKCEKKPIALAALTGFMQKLCPAGLGSDSHINPLLWSKAATDYVEFRSLGSCKGFKYDRKAIETDRLIASGSQYLEWLNRISGDKELLPGLLNQYVDSQKSLVGFVEKTKKGVSNSEFNYAQALGRVNRVRPTNLRFHERQAQEGARRGRYEPLPQDQYTTLLAQKTLFHRELLLAEDLGLGLFHADIYVAIANGAEQYRIDPSGRVGADVRFKYNDGATVQLANTMQGGQGCHGPTHCNWGSGTHSHPWLRTMIQTRVSALPFNSASVKSRIVSHFAGNQQNVRNRVVSNLENQPSFHEMQKNSAILLAFMAVSGRQALRAKQVFDRDYLAGFRQSASGTSITTPSLSILTGPERNALEQLVSEEGHPQRNPTYAMVEETLDKLEALKRP